ncbi:alpha/beta hydrolase [Streptomyces sp. NPDC059193]|uniref:alpha/beta hydrolase n=1 Tax=Streptomyces sp. NPDC059193 TaxID=3346763 RepID=UPI00368FCC21
MVFVHGLWLHSTSWEPWAERFAEEGYEPVMPEWPGVPDTVAEARANPDSQADVGLDAICAAYADVVRALPEPPVLVGHSMGGFTVQRLLGGGLGRAAVAISPGQIKGVKALSPTQARSVFPVLSNPGNKHRAVSLTAEQFRHGFANAVSPEESNALYEQWAMPSPARPLFELAFANVTRHSPAKVDTGNEERGPLLLISGKLDHTIPDVLTRSAHKQYRHSNAVTDYHRFDDRGHSLIIDSGWPTVAQTTLDWLTKTLN